MLVLTPDDLRERKPIAVFHYSFVFSDGRTAWCNYQCLMHGEVTSAIHCSRHHEERFYIEWTGEHLNAATLPAAPLDKEIERNGIN